MQRISKPLGSIAYLTTFVSVNNNGLASANMQFTFQCMTATSQNYGLFYDNTAKAWITNPVWNPLINQPENPGVYVASVDTSTIASKPEDYIVTYKSFTSGVPFIDAEIWQFGAGIESTLAELRLIALGKRTLSRINGDFAIQESFFDEQGNERIRLLSVQDQTGNQPEETRLNTSGNIA